jgi:hypothetical protein
MDDIYKEGFRLLKQYQIKEIFWRETNHSCTSEYRRKVWDAIQATEAERKYNISSGILLSRRRKAGKIIKKNLDKETFKIFKKDCRELNFSAMGDYMEKHKLYHLSDEIWKYYRTFGRAITEGKVTWTDKKNMIRSFRQGNINKKRLLNKMDKYVKWIKDKYRGVEVKGKMICKENGTEQEITEENWNLRLDQLANRAMDNYERPDILRFINFRFNWNEKSKIREVKKQKQIKSEHMPVKMTITSKLQKPHRVYSQACSLDEFNFVFDHLRMGSTSNYNKKAIICLMSLYHARKLVEADKQQKAAAAVSNLKRTDNPESDERILSGRESLGNDQYSKLSEEKILSLGGKSAPNLIATKSTF